MKDFSFLSYIYGLIIGQALVYITLSYNLYYGIGLLILGSIVFHYFYHKFGDQPEMIIYADKEEFEKKQDFLNTINEVINEESEGDDK